MRTRLAPIAFARAALLMLLASCDGGASTETGPGAPTDNSRTITSLSIGGPPSLQVNESALFTVTARNATGAVIESPTGLTFASADPVVATVGTVGAVQGRRRGTTSVSVSVGTVTATATIRVRARLSVSLRSSNGDGCSIGEPWELAVGDTLPFQAHYLDVNSVVIPEIPIVSWWSDHTDVAATLATGQVTGATPGLALIYAGSLDDTTFKSVRVSLTDAAHPATIRFANTMKDAGPMTFIPIRGDPITLAYGETVERQVAAGVMQVETAGLNVGVLDYPWVRQFCGNVKSGDVLSLFAVGGPSQGLIAAAWGTQQTATGDTALVRVVQGWTPWANVSLRPTGVAPSNRPDLCYFDATDVSNYYNMATGSFDVLLATKYDASSLTRVHVTVPVGRKVTLVLTGASTDDGGVLVFVDP